MVNVNTKDDKEQPSKSRVKTFTGVASPPSALGSKEFKQVNPMPDDAVQQYPHVLRKV